MLILARGGFTPAEAQGIVDRVHLRQEVTWNKPVPPEFHTEVRKTASLLTSIAVLSGVLGLAAVMLGLFLGLGRAWIRVLMGKPAATEPEFLRLDLSERPDDQGNRKRLSSQDCTTPCAARSLTSSFDRPDIPFPVLLGEQVAKITTR